MKSLPRRKSLSVPDTIHAMKARVLVFLIASLPFAALAGTAGQITHLSGTLSAKRADGSSKLLSVKSEVQEGDTLNTEAETFARIKFADGGEVVMRPGTQLKIESYNYVAGKPESDNVVMNMFKGGLRAVTGLVGKRNREKITFQTETATIGIRGTHFGALLCQNDCGGVPTTGGKPPPNGLHVDVTSGAVVMTNKAGTVQLNAGQFGFVSNASTPPQQVPPQQGIQVTMPSSIAQNKGGGKGIGKSEESECKL
ncbi:MAG: FecR domain-containing protein [Rhodocyclales bacterium]|nr:FecR domain-containing protein [Rhodocyclales bacterium]